MLSVSHVASKEGRCSVKVADVKDFWNGQKEIRILDPNITACKEKRDLMRQYKETGAVLDFTQGLDIRCMNDDDIDDINHMRLRALHFAWDNPNDDLEGKFRYFAEHYKNKRKGMVYVLTNFDSTMEENLHRISVLSGLGYDPFVMIYNKPSASKEIINLQRWCNNKFVFKKVPRFEDYLGSRHYAQINKGIKGELHDGHD